LCLCALVFKFLPQSHQDTKNCSMKTYKNLYDKICSFENLLLASRKARLGKRSNTDVAQFEINLEKELVNIREELLQQTYTPGNYTEFYIYEPKKRMISAAPYRDRVVHHALCNVIEPLFEKTFIYDSYANRTGKGTHKAIKRYQEFSRKNSFVLKCDIQKFFPSIDHEILKQEIRKKIGCRKTLWLIDTIIDNSNEQEATLNYFETDTLFSSIERRKGLPIGNLTSQFFANVYMNAFDHFVKEQLQCKSYVRYVDDFVVFGNEKKHLGSIKVSLETFLQTLRLIVHPNKTKVFPIDTGLCFLGHRVFPTFRLLKKENVQRSRRKLKKLETLYAQGKITLAKVSASVRSWIAHASFSDTDRLREKIFSNIVFVKE